MRFADRHSGNGSVCGEGERAAAKKGKMQAAGAAMLLLAICAVIMLAVGTRTAYADLAGTPDEYYNFGYITVSSDDADDDNVIYLAEGETAEISIYPYLHVTYQGCMGSFCPEGCGKDDACTFVPMLGCFCDLNPVLRIGTVTAEIDDESVVTAAEVTADTDLVASNSTLAQTTSGTVTITAESVGTTTVTVTASLYFWFPDTQTYTVVVTEGSTDADEVVDAVSGVLSRIGGSTRYETAALEALAAYDSADTVVIATGENFPDSLAATSLAGALEAPILLTKTAGLSEAAASAIEQLGATKVVVVGGESAVSADVVAELEASGLEVDRVCGTNRFETAEAIYAYGLTAADDGGSVWGDTLIVASGAEFADALSISPLAYAECYPILLVDADGDLPTSTYETILASGADSVIIVGGETAVSADVEIALAVLFDSEDDLTRLSGSNRYETSVAVAKYAVEAGYLEWDNVALADGSGFPDALAGSALQGSSGSVLLLVNDGKTSAAVDVLEDVADQIQTVRLLGGESAVSSTVASAIAEALGWEDYSEE